MKKRKWFWIVFVLLAALLLFWMLGGTDDADETTPVFTVAEGPLTIGITASGSVQSRDKVVLRSELEGKNTILFVVEDGVTVKVPNVIRGKCRGTRTATFLFNRTGEVGGTVDFSFRGDAPSVPLQGQVLCFTTERPRPLATTIQPQEGLAPLK